MKLVKSKTGNQKTLEIMEIAAKKLTIIKVLFIEKQENKSYKWKKGISFLGICIRKQGFYYQGDIVNILSPDDKFVYENNIMYEKPVVHIFFDNNESTTIFFNTDEEAESFFKAFCKEHNLQTLSDI